MNDELKTIKKRRKSKPSEKIIFSTRVGKHFDYTFRLEALKKKITMEESLKLYQVAYEEKAEREKAEKKAKAKKSE
jgi:hypothetical protein